MPQRCPSRCASDANRDKRRKKPRTEAADHPRVLPEPPTRRRQRHGWQWCDQFCVLMVKPSDLYHYLASLTLACVASNAAQNSCFVRQSRKPRSNLTLLSLLASLTPHYRQSTPRKITMISGIAARRAGIIDVPCRGTNRKMTDFQAATETLFSQGCVFTECSAIENAPTDFGSEVAFAGRSNSGKSSAINTLTHQGNWPAPRAHQAHAADQFFLLSEHQRLVDLPDTALPSASGGEKNGTNSSSAIFNTVRFAGPGDVNGCSPPTH